MASNSILKLQVDDKQYEASLKNAQQGLTALQAALRNSGKSFADVDKQTEQYVRELGKMEATAKTTRGRIGEMSSAFVELSRIEKQLTDQERQSPVGKALTESLAQLKQRTIDAKNELQGLENQIKNVGEVKLPDTGGLFGGGKLDGMLQVFGGNLMTKAAGAVANLGSEMYGMVQQGIEMAKAGEGIRIAFERLGRGDILDGLREATHGTVTDLDLMKAAVKFNDFKLPIEELGTMLAFAQQKAKDTGQSVDYMVDSIVTGLGRKSLMILDNLGLSATEIRERMKETGDMTKAVGAIIRDQMAAAGDYVETAADRAAQANVSLQNKMKELGRKFAPLEEASNNFWTSMKIGILDVVGGPLARLLNGLTEAGRVMNAYGKMGGSGKVGQMIANLAGASEQNRQSLYQQQQAQFWRYINPREQQIKDIRAWQSGQRGEALQGRINAITEKYGSLDATKIQAEVDAAKKMLSEYQQSAKQILQPIKQEITPTITTSGGATGGGGGGNTTTMTGIKDEFTDMEELVGLIPVAEQKVKDLQQQIRESWDQNEIVTLRKQLKEAQNDLDVLQGKLPKDTVAQITVTADTADALKNIQNVDGVTIDPKTFSITATDDALPLLREIEGVTIDPKTFAVTVTDEALPLLREIDGVTIDPKTMTVTADTSEALQEVQEMVSAVGGKIVDIKVVPIITDEDVDKQLQKQFGKAIEVPIVPKTMGQQLEQSIRIKLAEENMEADEQTLRTLLETQIKYGIESVEIPTDALLNKIIGDGINIPDDYWQNLQEQFNEKLKEMGKDTINIDFGTGKDKGNKDDKNDGKDPVKALKDFNSDLSQVTGGIGNIANGIQQLGIELPQGIQDAVSVLTGISSIITGITSILGLILVAQQTTAVASWTDAIIPFANGGIVPHAANGYYVPGNHYSNDVTPIMANAGELILNKAAQGNLASQLSGSGMQNMKLDAVITGEQIRLVLNNNGRRTGRGEYVQTNSRRV